jgi:hypothetical protein
MPDPAHLPGILFGPGTWGTGGNMVAWVICGIISFTWLYSKERAHHALKMAQSRAHHEESQARAQERHEEAMARAAEQHAEAINHASTALAHAEAARLIAADTYRHVTGEDHPVQNGK